MQIFRKEKADLDDTAFRWALYGMLYSHKLFRIGYDSYATDKPPVLAEYIPSYSDKAKRLPMRVAFVTDEDQFTDSKHKEYNLDELVKDNYAKLHSLREGINNGDVNSRINNMKAMSNGQVGIKICSGKKTLEYQICKANVYVDKEMTKETWLYKLIQQENPEGISKVDSYMSGLEHKDMSEVEQQNVALLMWKCLPSKAEFAQALNSFLLDKIEIGGDIKFTLPSYIQDAITHLVP